MRGSRSDRQENVRPAAPGAQAGTGARFAMVPWALQDTPRIDAATIAVYAALQRFSDFGRSTGARVSDRTAAKLAGVSHRTFRRRRETLRRLGWITWTSGKVAGQVNAYTVHLSRGGGQDLPTGSVTVTEGVGQSDRGGGSQGPTTESHYREPVTESQDRDKPNGEAGASGAEQEPTPKPNGGQPKGEPSPFAVLMPLVREHLYAPDGKPPAGWTERRDASVLQRLLAGGRSVDDLAVVIEGVALLRDQPGIFGEDAVTWLGPPGSKLTTRVLLKRSGTATVWMLAHRAYWTRENRRPRGAPSSRGPTAIADVLRARGIA